MVIRKIVKIDSELCNGCGQCIPLCAEGALQIIGGKARLMSDNYCDGLGACLGHCPRGAIEVIAREADNFDEKAAHVHIADGKSQLLLTRPSGSPARERSSLRNWPVQLNLVPLEAPYFNGCDLLIVADCVPVALPDLHNSLLPGKTVVLGCPKFDNGQSYVEKLSEMLKRNDVKRIEVAYMEVPCCSALMWIAKKAVEASARKIPLKQYVVTVKGEIKKSEP